MKLFYGAIENEQVYIDEEEEKHIVKVLRLKEGETVNITNGAGRLALGTLGYQGKKIILKSVEIKNFPQNPMFGLHIAIAPTRNLDRIEFFIEKATELGIGAITFLLTDNSERKTINLDRVEKQIMAASKQSLRVYFPKINGLQKFSDFIERQSAENTFVAHCSEHFERKTLHEIKPKSDVCFLVGPEGDFSDRELKELYTKGSTAISLGSQRLRTETAGILIAAWHYSKHF